MTTVGKFISLAAVLAVVYFAVQIQPVHADVPGRVSTWAPLFSRPAANSQATATQAGVPGVKHVLKCVSASANSAAGVTAANVLLNIRDGASGAGTVLWTQTISFPTAGALGVQEMAPIQVCGLDLIGTAGNPMTVEFSAGVTGAIESVSASGYDIQ